MSSNQPWTGLVARIQATATRAGRSAGGEFSLEGTRLVERALRAEAPLAAVLVSERYGESEREAALLRELSEQGVTLQRVPEVVASALTQGRTFGAILGLVRQLDSDAPLARNKDLLVAVDVQDPGNLGALLRTAAASGAGALIAVGTSDPFHPKAVRTSMGSLFKVPVVERASADAVLTELKRSGHSTLAAVSRGGLLPWSTELPAGPHAVLVGSEAHGLPTDLQAACDARVSLPQRDDLDSYSVNAAAAMLLYELTRRRAH